MLDDANVAVLEGLLNNAKAEQLPKCAALIDRWRKWLLWVERERCGGGIGVEVFSEWHNVQRHCRGTAVMTDHARQIMTTIPSIANDFLRKKAAQKYTDNEKQIDSEVFVFRLKEIIDGKKKEKVVDADDEEAGNAADEADEVPKAKKRQKTK